MRGLTTTDSGVESRSKITALAPFRPMQLDSGPELFCRAHKEGVRMLSWSEELGCPTGGYYQWALAKDPRMFDNDAVHEWAVNTSSCLAAAGYDGVSLGTLDTSSFA